MRIRNVFFSLALVGTTALVTATVLSQDKPGGDKPEWMTPEAMKNMMPGENHKKLDQFVGTWNQNLKFWMDPNSAPEEHTGQVTYSWVLDGHYLKGEYSGDMDGMPFKGVEYMGYDNMRNQYFSVWFDNMGTGVMVSRGQLEGDTMKMSGKMDDAMTGKKDVATHSTCTIVNPNTMKMEMFSPGPDGKDIKSMEATATRVP